MDLSENALRKHKHSIHDPVSKVLIPVRSSADSRIGQFALSHGLSASGFDELILLLKEPGIRTSEITFSSGPDFFRTIAEYNERLQSTPSFPPLGLLTPVVLDGVLDVMRQCMCSFVDPVEGPTRRTLRNTLRSMALVHRSWVQPVHGLLHKRYYLTSDTLPAGKVPPRAVAVAIRELAMDYQSDTSLRPLIYLLRHLPSLQSLSIGMQKGENILGPESMCALFNAIGTLSNLEMLLFPSWRLLSSYSDVPTPLLELCEALSNLPRLSVLWLSRLHYSGTDAETQLLLAKLANLKPPSLKTLVINIPLHRTSLPGIFLRWISSHPQTKQPLLENLIMSPDIPTDPGMALDLGNGPGFSGLRRLLTNRSTYDAIYPLAKDLKALYLSIVKDTLPDRLPPRLQALHVQFSTGDAQADEAIVSLLRRSDTVNLERIVLDEVSPSWMRDRKGRTIFPRLTDFCGSSVELERYYSGHNEWKCFSEIVKFLLP